MVDATNAVKAMLGVEFLRGSFDHVVFLYCEGNRFERQIRLDDLCSPIEC